MRPKFRSWRRLAPLLALLAVAGCQDRSAVDRYAAASSGGQAAPAPSGATEGNCWARDSTPAVLETVTEQIIVEPELRDASGWVIRPAVYRTETRQEIVQERKDTVFQVPCPDEMTPELIASLQRALQARGLYRGPVSGVMDAPTRTAIRRYQKPLGLDSGILSLATARVLGLVALDRPR
ncbi:peptidoglycan-binding protein [Roseovarius faecimaris]|uniref:Peptidoglycan-binding protein n=1 Tax=Roseovarius faecimaris TaxID=2494550 RepID=A0A6I6IKY6_9RHOB|nr:peptidoglycan-binding domain-containing protein [Roseovarius faecimaris]QGX97690.1 peptidoglycan-binding protein [Roseovarius faecimaris]